MAASLAREVVEPGAQAVAEQAPQLMSYSIAFEKGNPPAEILGERDKNKKCRVGKAGGPLCGAGHGDQRQGQRHDPDSGE